MKDRHQTSLTMASTISATCKLMSLPAEIRLMILRKLLCYDEVLADIPTIMACVKDPHALISRSFSDVRRHGQQSNLADTEYEATTTEPIDRKVGTAAHKLLSGASESQHSTAGSIDGRCIITVFKTTRRTTSLRPVADSDFIHKSYWAAAGCTMKAALCCMTTKRSVSPSLPASTG